MADTLLLTENLIYVNQTDGGGNWGRCPALHYFTSLPSSPEGSEELRKWTTLQG